MNVSLPEPLKAWAESRAKTGRYANASDYVRDLIRKDIERSSKIEALQAMITRGLESGVSERSLDEILTEARQRASTANAD
ncbi:MAG: type II toxin-antitoxin system ParD family antitoxin [Parvularculaceae bacterium]|nr:type II toxin-antitoxin system ParD family antitoxin [Parvularculaceae bacterium]